MIVTFTSRHTDGASLKQYAEQKANKLTKYFDRITEIEVVVDHEDHNGTPMKVEMIVNAEHSRFVAHHSDGNAFACVDMCVDKLERQLSDHKKMLRNRKHPE